MEGESETEAKKKSAIFEKFKLGGKIEQTWFVQFCASCRKTEPLQHKTMPNLRNCKLNESKNVSEGANKIQISRMRKAYRVK